MLAASFAPFPLFLTSAVLFALHCTTVTALTHGDVVDWQRHAYLVKVLVNDKESGVSACTGTLVTAKSVLTSSKCFDGVRKQSDVVEAIVMILLPKLKEPIAMKVHKVNVNGEFALISIEQFTNDKLCEGGGLFRATRLPLRPSFTTKPWNSVDADSLTDKKCRITAFNTTETALFTRLHVVSQVSINDLQIEEDLLVSQVDKGRGACWDDIGAPLECQLSTEDGPYTQVGFLHSVVKATDGEKGKSSGCESVQAMRFVIFSNDDVASLLDNDRIAVVDTYFHCFD